MNPATSAKEHTCYFCGDSEETVLIPICKGCLDSFNEFMEKYLADLTNKSGDRDGS